MTDLDGKAFGANLPLYAAIWPNKRYAVPIQPPFSLDGRYVVVANTGTANASVI